MTGIRAKNPKTKIGKKRTAKAKTAGTKARKAPLGEYVRKRHFDRTPEPKPTAKRAAKAQTQRTTKPSAEHATVPPSAPPPEPGDLVFAIQRHDARRLHWDLRLELDGVLKSWAVTKGPSLTVGEKRLAVRTEDHPMDYLRFEGNIPKGEYGGGSVIVWDLGHWVPEGDPHKGFKKGHLDFRLDGARLRGRWHLVRMNPRRGEKTEPWLLIKSRDEFSREPGAPEIVDEELTSALTGITSEEMAATSLDLPAAHAVRVASTRRGKLVLPDIGKIAGARTGPLPAFIEPSLASPCGKPPSGPKWIHEIKHDGYRIQARIDGAKGALLTRKGLDWTARFPHIVPVLTRLGLKSATIDGEIVVEDEAGVTTLNNLQAELKSGRKDRFRYLVFDLLHCNSYDLTRVALSDRKDLLQNIVSGLASDSLVRFSEHLAVDGPTMLAHACRMGLEGIVSKRIDLGYRTGRNDSWLKAKCQKSQEFVILGYVRSTAASGAVGSLVLGYYDRGKLVYAGRVGTGWSLSTASALYGELNRIKAAKPVLRAPLPAGAEKGIVWAEPRLVCVVEFRAWTDDGIILQASFKGLREDKPAAEVSLEEPPGSAAPGIAGVPPALPSSETRRNRGSQGKSGRDARDPRGAGASVTLTHPERILWPEAGLTKQGLADYYTDIADWILPHVAGRVLSLLRCPSGVSEQCFFAKHPFAGLNRAVQQIDMGEDEPMLALDDIDGLLNLVQAGVVEIHPWGSRTDDLDHPDRLIFDLDPGEGATWDAVIAAAVDVRDRLLARGLASFVKTSGGKGLHVVVPVEPKADWAAAKAFTASIAEAMAADHPDRYVATAAKRARRGRIYIDYLRNDRGSTAVAAYSTRSLPQAPVSTPLAWDELSSGLRSDHFTVGNLRNRLAFLARDPWQEFFSVRQWIPDP
jgi:bifunctional non-homologous end joining protein LigD